jgi:4-azaleucine resistance transporter AzlC
MTDIKKTLKTAFFKSLPIMAGYIVLGTGFGILLTSKGYARWWALLMSLTIYAGSMQYVAIDLLTAGASLISTALMTLMVNARHLFYGVSMLSRYRDTGKAKPYLIFALTDETYSLVCSDELIPSGVDKKRYFLFVSLLNQFYWVLGSVIGGLLGSFLTFNTNGIDFAMTALFVVIFTEQWEKNKNHIPALIGVISSVLCLILFGAQRFLIPAMLLISALLLLLRKPIERRSQGEGAQK